MTSRRTIFPVLVVASLIGLALLGGGCSHRQDEAKSFATPDEAAAALVAAFEQNDLDSAASLIGPQAVELLDSGDPVADKADRAEFIAAYEAKHAFVDEGADRKTLVIGEDDWPMPIPLVQREGRWAWDGAAGVDELIYRRVGANELGAIDVMRGFVAAQQEYASEGRDGDPPGIYALKLLSDPGLHNGLYWEAADGDAPSPAGPFVAAAAGEGYRTGAQRTPYHGYFYRMLYAQGPNARAGEREYFRDGLLTEGFALIAWPAEYGSSGVQTFIVNDDGVVFQKDLGEETTTAVERIQKFDPDQTWIAVVPPTDSVDAAASEATSTR
jgi:hypothetical protein